MDLCSFLKGDTKNQNPVVKSFLKVIRSVVADAVKPCPYHGSFSLTNISADAKVLNWLPRGSVRFVFRMWNDKDANIIKLALIVLLA